MRIRLLGAHNLESRTTRMAALLVDGVLALDCGGLTGALTLAEQHRVRAVLLTHRHYDHLKDLLPLCLATFTDGQPIDLYALPDTLEALEGHLLDGVHYPDFRVRPSPQEPKLRLHPLEPLQEVQVLGYRVLPVPLPHGIPAVGYLLASPEGREAFYTGDVTQGLGEAWRRVRPHLLIVEVTFPNALEERARETFHLTPRLLRQEVAPLAQQPGGLPPVVVVHMHPAHEEAIRGELASLARETGATITPAYEGMEVEV